VEEIDGIHLVTNSRFAPTFRAWTETLQQSVAKSGGVTVHDDGTTSNEDRLGAIGDLAFAIERAGLEGEDLLVVAGDNLVGYSLPEFVGFWRDKGGSAIAVYEIADADALTRYGVIELDADDRVVGFEEKPARPRSNLAATAAYLYRAQDLELLPRYLAEGNPPDAPGNFVAWLHTRTPVHGYRFAGEWHDIGDAGQLHEADNRLRERAGMPLRSKYTVD
jgi:glucose-1-phosphate thymidylyltransferase